MNLSGAYPRASRFGACRLWLDGVSRHEGPGLWPGTTYCAAARSMPEAMAYLGVTPFRR